MERCSCNMLSSLGEYHYYYHYFILCRDILVTCQVVKGNIIIIIIILLLYYYHYYYNYNYYYFCFMCPLMTSFGCFLLPYVCNKF